MNTPKATKKSILSSRYRIFLNFGQRRETVQKIQFNQGRKAFIESFVRPMEIGENV